MMNLELNIYFDILIIYYSYLPMSFPLSVHVEMLWLVHKRSFIALQTIKNNWQLIICVIIIHFTLQSLGIHVLDQDTQPCLKRY
jgi:hypothetical protein